jgi:outer membrane protein insertion porin family
MGLEEVTITTFPDSPLLYQDYVNTFGPKNTNFFLTLGWVRETRDSLIYPTKGSFHRATSDVGLPVADLEYYKLTYQYQRYFPLTSHISFMINSEFGYGDGYNDKPLPFFKNFFAGGPNSVRGFKSFTIGPKDANGDPRGGSQKVVGNAELLMPLPGLWNDRSVRVSAFVDTGNVDDKIETDLFRVSAGLSLLWVSPIGPLKLIYGVPIRKQPLDEVQRFQFTIGGIF